MAIKKSAIYSQLWQSCDALRGGMDASQYKDYVLALLFVKYISDKYKGKFAEITVPKGSTFSDMAALKGRPDIGDQLNKKIFEPIAEANGLPRFANFNDESKLGKGAEMVERLDRLIGIFEDLDFTGNRAEGDDILGDAYEYLMRNFATESGKSKGQFYTPSEVSRVIAGISGIGQSSATADTTVYDPTCGSGSLLLKMGGLASAEVALYGQEKDVATQGLARMNMVLHGYPGAEIAGGNTLTDPIFLEQDRLQTFDYVVANPPFSDKAWITGLMPEKDIYRRFVYGVPPESYGDYAYLLHILASLKPTGKGACILPHGALFRGNAEAGIRLELIKRGYIKGIIGLPPNLFYGTGIPACIIVLDKEGAAQRQGIFMIDASRGFMKDGPKNRLRERDVHRIIDVFVNMREIPGYSRMAGHDEILERNGGNLNLPRYINIAEAEDRQDIEAHLHGGIPAADIDALADYWKICPGLRSALFAEDRPGYSRLAVGINEIRSTIHNNREFATFLQCMKELFAQWRQKQRPLLAEFKQGDSSKKLGEATAEDLLAHYGNQPLIDSYAAYQIFMDLWDSMMQDDCYVISYSGWKPEITTIVEIARTGRNKGKEVIKGWTCDLTPKELVLRRFFFQEQAEIDKLRKKLSIHEMEISGLEEEDSEGINPFVIAKNNNEDIKIDKIFVNALIKSYKKEAGDYEEELAVLNKWQKIYEKIERVRKEIKKKENELDEAVKNSIPNFTEEQVKNLVIDDKWLDQLEGNLNALLDEVEQKLAVRIKELAERYTVSLIELNEKLAMRENKFKEHLQKMGFEW